MLNRATPEKWKEDYVKSISFYNDWYTWYASATYREQREKAGALVQTAFSVTKNLTDISPEAIRNHPSIIQVLRMATVPPIARDRLSGLSGVSRNVIENLENGKVGKVKTSDLEKITSRLKGMLDMDLFSWARGVRPADGHEEAMAFSVVVDRICSINSDPIIRNGQEERQLTTLRSFFEQKGYRLIEERDALNKDFRSLPEGYYAIHVNVAAKNEQGKSVKTPVDFLFKPQGDPSYKLPVLIECKSAGDAVNVNKRQQEEVTKAHRLKSTYGNQLQYIMFLCGYFNPAFLETIASESIDWVWEHRIEDFESLI